MWADGVTPRSDGLTWVQSDFVSDGTHPAISGRTKVANMLMDFFQSSPYTTCWFTVACASSTVGGIVIGAAPERPPDTSNAHGQARWPLALATASGALLLLVGGGSVLVWRRRGAG